MIAAEFEYLAPGTLDDALGALSEGDGDAKALAGGHSLLPLMKLRFAAPSLLVDLRQLSDLRGLERDDGSWRIGALTRHSELQARPELGILAEAAALIADQQVRNRGTLGGSLAHGDSAADLPTVLLAAEGSVTVRRPSGSREIAAADLFLDYLTTAIEPDEVLIEVRMPTLDGWGHAYENSPGGPVTGPWWAPVPWFRGPRTEAAGTCVWRSRTWPRPRSVRPPSRPR